MKASELLRRIQARVDAAQPTYRGGGTIGGPIPWYGILYYEGAEDREAWKKAVDYFNQAKSDIKRAIILAESEEENRDV